jgi:hypothetical protein
LSKIISFWFNHIAHNRGPMPTRNKFLKLLFIFITQIPNIWFILTGGPIPKVNWITCHINLAIIQSSKKCCMVSWLLQKQHFVSPCQLLLTKLSLNITLLNRNQRKTLTFSGSLSFHKYILCGTMLRSNNAWYIEITENWPLEFSDHMNISRWSFKCIFSILVSRLCQDRKFLSTRDTLNEILRGMEIKILSMVALFFLTMLHKFGYCSLMRFDIMGSTSPELSREEQGAYHESAHSAKGHGPGGP